MSVQLRWEQCCESPGCSKPARFGDLCAACFQAATPARRAAELLQSRPSAQRPLHPGPVVVDEEGAAWLSELWAA